MTPARRKATYAALVLVCVAVWAVALVLIGVTAELVAR